MKKISQFGIASLLGTAALLSACSQSESQQAQTAPSATLQHLGPQPGDVDEGPTPAELRDAWLKRGVEPSNTTPAKSDQSSAGGGGEGTSRLK